MPKIGRAAGGFCPANVPHAVWIFGPSFPLLEGMSAVYGCSLLCLPLCPFMFPFVGWCARLPDCLVFPGLQVFPIIFSDVCLCWMKGDLKRELKGHLKEEVKGGLRGTLRA